MMPETNNNSLNFIESGDGEITLVFLHYFGGSSKSWSVVINELKNTFHCVAVDQRGFGNFPAPVNTTSVCDSADDIVQLIIDLQLKKYVLIGHSMGGKIALSVASQKPAGLISLILIAPSPPTPEPSAEKDRINLIKAFGNRPALEKLIKKITAKDLADILFEETVQDHLYVNHVAWNGWIKYGSREDISSNMSNIDVPVLVISGESDPNFSTAFLRTEFMNYFPMAQFEEIKEAGHLLPVEVPRAVAIAINEFASDYMIHL